MLSICYVSNAQKAFDQVMALLNNLKASNIRDQKEADVREKQEREWCKKEIAKAVRLLARRQHDVDSLEAHIKFLFNTRTQAEKDRKTRQDRIVANLALLKKFKKQRCENNLLFVKTLREHMQGVETLRLLRGDIVDYFNRKPKGQRGVAGAFIEKFEEYQHLLDDTHKAIYTELKTELMNLAPHHKLDRNAETRKNIKKGFVKRSNALTDRLTAHKARTAKDIGTAHVDNTRGELKRLKTPKFQKIAEFNIQVRTKILKMIDNLIAHLEASRERLTKDEIRAAEDFAIFHNNMEKENEYLEEKIAEITKEILNLTNQINVAKVQLVKRKKLRDEAKRKLELLRQMCEQKYAYFASETARRNRENIVIDSATRLFVKLMKSTSARIRSRASAGVLTGKVAGTADMQKRVVSSERGVKGEVAGQQKVREAVVF
jgi:hypothetical protein